MKPFTYIRRDYTPEEEELVRAITNVNGRGNAAYDPEAARKMLPQDRLVEAEITLTGITGVAIEFRWASGRKDAWIQIDLPRESVDPQVIKAQRQLRKNAIRRIEEQHGTAA